MCSAYPPPFAFAGSGLRRDERFAAEAAAAGPRPGDLLLLLDSRGQALFDADAGRLVRISVGAAGARAGDPGDWVFLGADAQGRRHWAAMVEEGLDAALFRERGNAAWADPRRIAHRLTMAAREQGACEDETGDLAAARALLFWHRDNRHCGRCGAPTRAHQAGLQRRCDACGRTLFPRVDPAVLVLVHSGEACVLARGRQFPEGMYSTIAGFVLPGETAAAAAARETREELGLAAAGPARFVASQPWPFPYSLMLGFHQPVHKARLRIDENELADARWFRREQARRLLEESPRPGEDGIFVPPPLALAHHLIALWVAGG